MAAHEHPLTEERRQALQRVWLMLYVQQEMPKLEATASGCWPVSIDRDEDEDCWYVLLFCPDRGPDNGLYVLVSEDGSLMWWNDMRVPNFHLGAHPKYMTRN